MRILVTGGAGSIGSAFALSMVKEGHDVRILDVNEEGLWALQNECPALDCRLGDVQFENDLLAVMDGVSAVAHCAAYKHVHLCEKASEAAFRVNVGGTENVLHAATGRRVVLLSTDKAIRHTSVMGKAKYEAERLTTLAPNANIVRFGNVIGSRGSLVPAVQHYAALGMPIPLTSSEMTRFFITIDEAVGLIKKAMQFKGKAPHPFGPEELRSANIKDFIEVCRDLYAPGLEIQEKCPRAGEAFYEELMDNQGERVRSDEQRFLMDKKAIRELLIKATKRQGAKA